MERSLSGVSRRAALGAAAAGLAAAHVRLARATDADAGPVADILPEVDRLVADAMARTGIPGLAAAVVYKDTIVYLKGFGVREKGRSDPVDPDTVFQLASLSKPVTSTVIGALVGDGLVGWDDPIVAHDSAFAMFTPWVTSQVTLRDMLCHRSGLPDHAGDHLEDIGFDRSAVLHRLRYQRPDSSFRSQYAYTNFGFTEAAIAAARASGKPWETLASERLYQPLGMQATSSRYADLISAGNRARLHVMLDGKWVARYTRDADAQSPAGGVSSSARDMAAWIRLQLAGGTLGASRIVDADALAETHRPQMIRVPPPKNPSVDHAGLYGLGWNVEYDEAGRVRLGHSGAFNLGAATAVSLVPAAQLGIIVLTNAQPVGVPEAVTRSFLDLALTGKVERDWLALFQQVFEQAMAPDYGTAIDYAHPPSPAAPALPADAYAGSYASDLFGELAVVAIDTGLNLRLGPAGAVYPMQHFDRDAFSYQPSGENAYGRSAVTFAIGAGRKATAVTLENLDRHQQGTFQRTGSKT